jgi:hypothetical protein
MYAVTTSILLIAASMTGQPTLPWQVPADAEDHAARFAPTDSADGLPDFSGVGYRNGEADLPDPPVVMTVAPGEGDDTARVQAGIDAVGQRPPDATGYRGTLLLLPGTFEIDGALQVRRDGVVVRGSGADPETGTTLIATRREPHVMFFVSGQGNQPWQEDDATRRDVAEAYVPVGRKTLQLTDAQPFAVGDEVLLVRPGSDAWLARLQMDRLSTEGGPDPDGVMRGVDWTVEETTLRYLRRITAIDGNTVTLDAPVVSALDQQLGGGYLVKYTAPGQLRHIGIEHLRLVSEFDESVTAVYPQTGETYHADEEHGKTAILLKHVRDAFVRHVTFKQWSHNAVHIDPRSAFVTVSDCASLDPVSRITGRRRYAFAIGGQRNLVTRCYSDRGRHDFVFSRWAAGPNVFFDNVSEGGYSFIEPHGQMNPGNLYDNVIVDGRPRSIIATLNRGTSGRRHGWTGTSVVWWNCDAMSMLVMSPPEEPNYLIGRLNVVRPNPAVTRWVRDWAMYRNGGWPLDIHPDHPSIAVDGTTVTASLDAPARPRSLYLKQLHARLGNEGLERMTSLPQRKRLSRLPAEVVRPPEAAGPHTQGPYPSLTPLVEERYRIGELLASDSFDSPDALDRWTIQIEPNQQEQAPPDVAVRDGRLEMFLPGVGATAWFSRPFSGPIALVYHAQIPSKHLDGGDLTARDINTFVHAQAPEPMAPEALLTHPRFTGSFTTYHSMTGYYASTGGSFNTTTRMRIYPRQTIDGEAIDHVALTHRDGNPDYLVRPDRWYQIQIIAADGLIQYMVDGRVVYQIQPGNPVPVLTANVDDQPTIRPADPESFPVYTRGFVGLRAVKTHHQYDDFRVWRLVTKPRDDDPS